MPALPVPSLIRQGEGLEEIPGITVVPVKQALSRTAARCQHPAEARERIREGVARALAQHATVQPYVVDPPVELRVSFTNSVMADAAELMPSATREDGRTVRFELDDYLVEVGALRAAVFIARPTCRP